MHSVKYIMLCVHKSVRDFGKNTKCKAFLVSVSYKKATGIEIGSKIVSVVSEDESSTLLTY